MKEQSRILKFAYVAFAAQITASATFIFYIFKLGILPGKMVLLSTLAVCLLAILSGFLLIKKYKIFALITPLIIAVMLCFPIHVMKTLDNTLGRLQGETDGYHSKFEILVRNDDKAQKLSDISEYITGIDMTHDEASAEAVIKEINKRLNSNINIKKYESAPEVWAALTQDKTVDAVIIDHAFYEMYREMFSEQGDSVDNYVKAIENITVSIKSAKVTPSSPSVSIQTPGQSFDPSGNETPSTDPIIINRELCEKPFVIYVSGIDIDGPITLRSRSDVNILIVVDPLKKNMLLVTVPRDTYVPFPGVSNGQPDKLTHAGIYGNNCSVSIATLEQYIYTGIHIDRWIRVNFTSVVKMVDALGGITVQSHYDFSAGGYHFNKGANHVNGAQALMFARERKSFALGDMQRGRHQLEVIKGIFNKAISASILTSYDKILNVISNNIQTNISYSEIAALSKMQLEDNASWNIEMMSIDVEYEYNKCYSMPGMDLCVGIMDETSRINAVNAINNILGKK